MPVAAGLVVLATAAIVAYLAFVRRADGPVPFAQFAAHKITNQGNVAANPAISPDGTYVAYVTGDDAGETLRLRQLTTGAESVIVAAVQAPSHYAGLAFSADGQYIYYVITRELGALVTSGPSGFYRVPFIGGPSTRLIENVRSMVGLAPDGKRVAFVRTDAERGEQRLITANMDGGNERVIASAKFDHGFIGSPGWSPDGKTIAISAWQHWAVVVAFPADGGPGTVLGEAQKWGASKSLAWTPDGRGLIVTVADKSSGWFFQLWHVSFPAGTVRRMTNDANNYTGVSLPRDGSSILTLQSDWLSSLSVASASDPDQTSPLGVGRGDGIAGVAWAPDGRVVYGTREWDIATIDADGRNQRTLTADEHNNRHPRVTTDGRYIFFMSWRSTTLDSQYRMNIDGGDVRRVSGGGSGDFPQVTPDGKWLLVWTSRSGKNAIWKVSTDGGQEQLFSAELETPCTISPDGTLVAGMGLDAKTQRPAVKVVTFERAATVKAFELPEGAVVSGARNGWIPIRWTADGTGVVYACRHGSAANLWVQALAGGQPHRLTNFKSDDIWDFDWSRDNKIVYARGRMNQDVLMISREK